MSTVQKGLILEKTGMRLSREKLEDKTRPGRKESETTVKDGVPIHEITHKVSKRGGPLKGRNFLSGSDFHDVSRQDNLHFLGPFPMHRESFAEGLVVRHEFFQETNENRVGEFGAGPSVFFDFSEASNRALTGKVEAFETA